MTLLRTLRYLLTFDKTSEEEIDRNKLQIDVNDLRRFVIPRSDDPLYIDAYILDASQIETLNRFAEKKVIPDFSKCYYMLACFGVYDWMENKE